MPGEPQKLRVFLAEDNLGDVYLIKEALRANNYAFEIDRSEDGESSLGKLSRFVAGDVPDLIIIDLNMPKMDGLQLLAAIKSSPQWRTIPVVMITTEGGETKVGEAVKLGAAGYVRKPFTADQIKEKLAGILEGVTA